MDSIFKLYVRYCSATYSKKRDSYVVIAKYYYISTWTILGILPIMIKLLKMNTAEKLKNELKRIKKIKGK